MKLVQFLMYGNFNSIEFEMSKKEIDFENYNRVQKFSFIFGCISFTIFIMSFFINILKDSNSVFLIITFSSFFTYFLSKKINQKYLNFLYYFFITAIFLNIGIVNINYNLNASASAISGFYIFFPILFMDKPYRFIGVMFLTTIILGVDTLLTKSFPFTIIDILNLGLFNILSIFITLYLFNERMLVICEKRKITIERDTDYLTGLKSRSAFESFAYNYLIEGSTTKLCALILLDLDNFKQVNDTFGHLMGDYVLKEVARILKTVFFENAYISRIGGDEFTIFIKECKNKEVLLNQVKQVIEKLNQISIKNENPVGCSVGITFPKKCVNYKNLFKKADKAMYEAKQKGKNCFVIS